MAVKSNIIADQDTVKHAQEKDDPRLATTFRNAFCSWMRR